MDILHKPLSKGSLNSGDGGASPKKDDRLFLKVNARQLQHRLRETKKSFEKNNVSNLSVTTLPPNQNIASIVRIAKKNKNLNVFPPLSDVRHHRYDSEQYNTRSSSTLN